MTKKKRTFSLSLIFMLALLALVPEVQATTFRWNWDYALVYGPYTDISDYWATNGYWDVKGFQWGDPGTTYPSGFNYTWQNGVVTIWVGDWEHDWWEGTTVGAVRQGSVWDLETAPWYDQTTYQPSSLRFGGKSAVTLSARVRKDYEYRTLAGWINWLFNPWFRVVSTFAGETKERKMVWDIVWGYNFLPGMSTAHHFVDGDQNLHLAFFVEEMAQTGEWMTYTIDLLDMAEQALDTLIPMPGGGSVPVRDVWQFEVDDLYLWSIDALVEGYDYDSMFSVDLLEVAYDIPNSPPNTPSTPSGPTSGYTGASYTYSTSTTDPDGDDLMYQFDWDDGSIQWISWYDSGETVSVSHTWGSSGTYYVRVRAKDSAGLWSGWSSSLAVTISSGGGGGGGCSRCWLRSPTLFVWNGSEYVEEAIFDLHGDSDTTIQRTIEQLLVPEDDHYLLSLREFNESISHIDYVKLYTVDTDGTIYENHLTHAMHNELGNVKQLLRFDDDNRADLGPSQVIDLKFNTPEIENIAYFIFEIQGYEPH